MFKMLFSCMDHILLFSMHEGHNDALCPVKHSFCLATCSVLPMIVLRPLDIVSGPETNV